MRLLHAMATFGDVETEIIKDHSYGRGAKLRKMKKKKLNLKFLIAHAVYWQLYPTTGYPIGARQAVSLVRWRGGTRQCPAGA